MGGSHESITEVVERFENVLITGADSGTVWRNKKDKNKDNLRKIWDTMKNSISWSWNRNVQQMFVYKKTTLSETRKRNTFFFLLKVNWGFYTFLRN